MFGTKSHRRTFFTYDGRGGPWGFRAGAAQCSIWIDFSESRRETGEMEGQANVAKLDLT